MGTIGYYLFYGIIWIVMLLPLPVLYIISDFLYLILYYFPSYRRKVVTTNLRNAFPAKTETELKCIGKKFYRHLADLFIESSYTCQKIS
jgi:KDO2-lipid IV(A) lauroyltransferase